MCVGKFNSEYLYIKIKLFINMEQDKKLKNFIKTTIREFLNENINDGFTTGHFIIGDEVYLVGGNGEPVGMVVKIGEKNIYIKPHDTNKKPIIIKKPNELYLGKEWDFFNVKK